MLEVTHQEEIKVAHGVLRVVVRQRCAHGGAVEGAEATVSDASLYAVALRKRAEPRRADKSIREEVSDRVRWPRAKRSVDLEKQQVRSIKALPKLRTR